MELYFSIKNQKCEGPSKPKLTYLIKFETPIMYGLIQLQKETILTHFLTYIQYINIKFLEVYILCNQYISKENLPISMLAYLLLIWINKSYQRQSYKITQTFYTTIILFLFFIYSKIPSKLHLNKLSWKKRCFLYSLNLKIKFLYCSLSKLHFIVRNFCSFKQSLTDNGYYHTLKFLILFQKLYFEPYIKINKIDIILAILITRHYWQPPHSSPVFLLLKVFIIKLVLTHLLCNLHQCPLSAHKKSWTYLHTYLILSFCKGYILQSFTNTKLVNNEPLFLGKTE